VHDFAERKKHQKKIGEKNVQHQHEGMTRHGDAFGEFRL
jgi:hypothetical protein